MKNNNFINRMRIAMGKEPLREPEEVETPKVRIKKSANPIFPDSTIKSLTAQLTALPITAESLSQVRLEISDQDADKLLGTVQPKIQGKQPIFDDELYMKRGPRTNRDYANKRFGKLLVICIDGHDKSGNALWRCKCDCGRVKHIRTHHLSSGDTVSCGCHRKSHTPTLTDELFAAAISTLSNPHREPVAVNQHTSTHIDTDPFDSGFTNDFD